MTATRNVLDVTDATFQSEVIEQSFQRPVVVDFWAAWCGPCRILGPTIEKVAGEFAGEVALAKLNVDENPRASQQYRISGIPAVKAFRNGQMVDEFTGALPEPMVREFFASLAPSPAQRAAQEAEALAARGDAAGAEQLLRDALARTPDDADAIVGLATLLARRGEAAEAEQLLARVPGDRRAKVLKHRIFLEGYAARHDARELQADAAANPRDPRARYRWGLLLAAQEDYRAALAELLESVRWNRTWEDGVARKAMLGVFEILGMDHPLTREYQRKLEDVLF